ncbi:transmembrane 7 superfamily member 3-like isoform X2 [Ctenocephalides felis]|uniref:transmembrane 7 superfamily member 3-like isoform X2 n=1 Tax=Ctenocephalides felis TaxID=7515 RepID=UPI000E6E2F93|nr:transmembrane 7 superfamily member 3-like isoform X2 [Ctenocephalides felis]
MFCRLVIWFTLTTLITSSAASEVFGDRTAPVPGGCNMEFPTEQASYLQVYDIQNLHKVVAAPASVPNSICGRPNIKYDWYHYFLPSRDFSEQSYFQYLKDMVTVEQIMKHGALSTQKFGPAVTRLYNAIIGNGVVVALIASIENTTFKAAYVPYLTYSCSLVFSENSCDVLPTTFSKVLCGITFALGFALCFFGNKLELLQIAGTCSIICGILAYIASTAFYLSVDACLWISVLFATIGGISACYCQFSGMIFRLLGLLFSGLLLGLLLASSIVFYSPESLQLVQSNAAYYTVMIAVTILVAIFIAITTCCGNEISSAIVGSTLLSLPIDYYYGGHFQYVLINTIRYAIVNDFKYAVVTPPFQWIDGIISVVRLVAAVLGIWIQLRSFCSSRRNVPGSIKGRLLSQGHRSYGSDNVFLSP